MDLMEKLKKKRMEQMGAEKEKLLEGQPSYNPYEDFDDAYGADSQDLEDAGPEGRAVFEKALAEREALRKGYLIPNARTPKEDVPEVWEKIRRMFKK